MSKLRTQNYNSNLKSNLRNRSYLFSLDIIKLISSLPNQRIYWTICDQLLRSATSIGANIIEAKASSSRKDFIKFYEIALKSGNETKYWLYLLRDSNLVTDEDVGKLIVEAEELVNMIASSLLTLKGKK
ncbi:hypothetical protein A2125_01895 [Candidatus Woesebacteria bacterium GWB1_43_5]|uniref:Four helix bundle protein n=1 Tax=Candidatus Woesebacteria bacterium GWB1_43_5 TaxID=1802474 RepID=A0A1F7WRR0_9BACT|nr:MAG: hypothetical protein A2125_01895 [Candidatus Woesebacteria bacterium GWB1_43_5]